MRDAPSKDLLAREDLIDVQGVEVTETSAKATMSASVTVRRAVRKLVPTSISSKWAARSIALSRVLARGVSR